MHLIALYVNGNDDHGRMTRRTLMRYLNLTLILVLRSISSAVKRRFPKLDHLVEAGELAGRGGRAAARGSTFEFAVQNLELLIFFLIFGNFLRVLV